MKTRTHSALGLALILATSLGRVGAAETPAGYIDFGKFTPSESASQFVEVNINSNLIAMVSRLARKAEPEAAQLIAGLKAIRVNVIGLDEDNRSAIEQKVKLIRTQLDGQGWERIVTAQQKDDDVGVYLKTRGQESVEGVVVTVLSGSKQAVLINIVGDIQPDKLAMIGEQFNIDPLRKVGQGLKHPHAEADEDEPKQ